MKNHWLKFFGGTVKIKISGKLIEQFINRLTREKIAIWNVKRHGEETVTAYIKLEEISRLRKMMRHYDCKVKFIDRSGFPFFLQRMIINSGFVIGILSCLGVIFILSNMIWNINVEGANPKVEHDIKMELTEMGIKRGAFEFVLPDVTDIQRELTERIDSITWVGVELRGTTYHLQVVEKTTPDKKEFVSPRHLVAKKKGVIYDYFVEEGQPLIEINDFVNKGDILVSGILGKEGKTEIVASKGEIFAEIWYKSEVEVPLKTSFKVLTGDHKTKHYLKLFNFSIPFWGFGKVEFSHYEMDKEEKTFKFLKWELPIKYQQNIVRENEEVTRTYTREEAKDVALKMARKKLKEQIPEDSTIKGEKILQEAFDNGKVRLTIHFKVIEDIGKEQPIIQGD